MLRVARVTVLGAACAAFAVACFTKPDAPHAGADAHDPDSTMMMGMDGSGSGSGSGSNGMCTTQPWDDFENTGTTTCGTWGGTGSGGVARGNGLLYATPTMTVPSICQTINAVPFAKGESIEIPQIAQSGMYNSTYFRVLNGLDPNEGMEVRLNWMMTNAIRVVQCLGSTTTPLMGAYGADDRWWKFMPSGNAVNVFHSADGSTWTPISATCTWSSTSTVFVVMGTDITAATNGTEAQFDNFNVKTCP